MCVLNIQRTITPLVLTSVDLAISGEGVVPEPTDEVAPPGEQGEKGGGEGGVEHLLLPQRGGGGGGGEGGEGGEA